MKKVSKLLLVLLSGFAFVSCGKNPGPNPGPSPTPEEIKATKLELVTGPTKTVYEEGEALDLSGLQLKAVYSNGTDEFVMDYTVDKDVLTPTDTRVTITWNGLTTSFAITVNAKHVDPVINGVETRVKEGAIYHRGDGVADLVEFRTTLSDGTFGDWAKITESDVKGVEPTGNTLKVNFEFVFKAGTFESSCTLPIVEATEVVSVEEFYQNTDKTEVQYINGIVLGEVCTMRADEGIGLELLIKDKTTEKIVAITNIFAGKQTDARAMTVDLHGIEKGDEVVVPVTVKISTVAEEKGRLLGSYAGGQFIETLVVSKDNPVTISTDDAFTITCEDDLKEFFGPENRTNNFYKILRMDAPFYTHSYSERFWRVYFDNTYTKNAEANIDGSSVTFLSCNTSYCAGKSFEDLVWGENQEAEWGKYNEWGKYTTVNKSIYAMFVGGNTYYHILTVLDESWVSDLENHVTGYKLTEPTKYTYMTGETLDLTGGKITKKFNLSEDVTVDLDASMLNAETLPDFTKAGKYTVKGTYEDYDFEFEVEVVSVVATNVEVISQPTKTQYGHRDSLDTIDLAGGKVRVTYSDGTTKEIEMTEATKPTEDVWTLGDVTYTMTIEDLPFTVTVKYVDESMGISEFMSSSKDEADVKGVIVGCASNCGRGEVILQDPETKKIIVIDQTTLWATSYQNPKLKKGEIGDLVIVKLSKTSSIAVTAVDKDAYKAFLVGEVDDSHKTAGWDSYNNIIIVSHNNEVELDLTTATTISTEEELQAFLDNPNRVGTIVKIAAGAHICGNKAAIGDNTQYRIWFGDVTALDDIKHTYEGVADLVTPIFYQPNLANIIGVDTFRAVLDGTHSASVTAPMTTTADIYAFFIGGNKSLASFVILDASWIVTPEVI